MRSDYALYAVAIICFIAAAYAVIAFAETSMYIYALAVLGIVFVGVGYVIRPKSTAVLEPTTQPTLAPEPKAEETTETKTEPIKEPKKKVARKRTTKRRTRRKKTTRKRKEVT